MSDHPVHRDDITAMEKQGDLSAYMRSLIRPTNAATPTAKKRGPRKPPYHVPRPGAWPCGTAASGPTPEPCSNCPPDIAALTEQRQHPDEENQ